MPKEKDSPDAGDSEADSDAHSEAASEHSDASSSESVPGHEGSSESPVSRSLSASENRLSATSEESDNNKGDTSANKTVLTVANTFSDDSDGAGDADSKDTTKSRTAAIRDIIRSSSSSLSIKKLAAEQPDLYGIRRSGRQRKEVARLTIDDKRKSERSRNRRNRDSESETASDSDDSYEEGRRTRCRVTRTRSGRRLVGVQSSKDLDLSDEDSTTEESSESEIETRRSKTKSVKKGSRSSKQRLSKRSTKQKISYKEESDEATDSDDLLEVEMTEVDQEKEMAESIEKVIRRRIGRKGATGSKTTMYNVDKDGDPNSNADPKKEETEMQYFIKWKNWSHLHNTWESEAGLREQKVNGLKKLENFIKKKKVPTATLR